jgi:Ring finger domain
MASPNVKVDKTVKVRRRNTLPGPLHKIRPSSTLLQKRHTTNVVNSRSNVGSKASTTSSTTTQWHHLCHSKTNPYVGWFSHSPSVTSPTSKQLLSFPKIISSNVVSIDTLWLRDWLVDTKRCHQKYKKRRITIMKDHCFVQSKSYQEDNIKSTLFRMKQMMEHRMDTTRDLNLDLLLLYKRRNGHLRGGGTPPTTTGRVDEKHEQQQYELDETTIEQYLQNQYASANESITVKALSRIACWLLDVPLHPPPTSVTTSEIGSCKGSQLDGIEEVGSILSYDDDDETTRSEYSYDNYDTVSGSRLRTNTHDIVSRNNNDMTNSDQNEHDNEPYSVGRGLSSQAEAYYALGAVYRHILAESTSNISNSEMMIRRRSDSVDEIDRLDYEITQMDIVRMNRIASRHLDVESIVRLPVLTYQLKNTINKKDISIIQTIPEDREPIIVSSSSRRPESRDLDNDNTPSEQNDTEFSWMLVPPSQDDESFDSSMDQYTITNNKNNTKLHFNHKSNSTMQDQVQESNENQSNNSDVCVICLEPFIPGDRLRVLPCTHSFHIGCIDKWLSGSHSFYDCYTAGCPTCKVRPDMVELPNSNIDTTTTDLSSQLHKSDGSVPSWALARIGHILAQESQHF